MNTEDNILQTYFKTKNLSNVTIQNYSFAVNKFCNFIGKSLTEIVEEAKEEQLRYSFKDERWINNPITKKKELREVMVEVDPDIENTSLAVYLYDFQKNCCKDMKAVSVDTNVSIIRTLLYSTGIDLPKKIPINVNDYEGKEEKIGLTPEKVARAINYANMRMKSLISFITCTGCRVYDARHLTFKDFLKIIDKETLNELFEINPEEDNIELGYWEFYPHKVKNTRSGEGILAQVCVAPDSIRHILRFANKRRLEGEEISEDTLVFSRKRNKNNVPYPEVYSQSFRRINKALEKEDKELARKEYEHELDIANAEMKQGYNIKAETRIEKARKKYEYKINNISKFHGQALRRFFISQCIIAGVTFEVREQFVGHSLPGSMDKHYVRFSKEEIINEYKKVIDKVSFNKTIIDKIEDEQYKKLKDELELRGKQLVDMNNRFEEAIDDKVSEKIKDLMKEYGF